MFVTTKVLALNTYFYKAQKLIERFSKENRISFRGNLILDFSFKHLGYVHKVGNDIYLNPIKCSNNKNDIMIGHPEDCSILSTIIHEFGHIMNYKFDLIEKYKAAKFKKHNVFLTNQSHENYDEELADLFQLFIINPYCLKIISSERLQFFSDVFASPTPCRLSIHNSFCKEWNKETLKKFNKKYKNKI